MEQYRNNHMIEQVAEMRRLQKLYFKTRDSNVLKACKVQEALIDKLISTYENKDIPNQQSLFENPQL